MACSVVRQQRDVVVYRGGGEAALVHHGNLALRGDAEHDGGAEFSVCSVLVRRDRDTPRLPNLQ